MSGSNEKTRRLENREKKLEKREAQALEEASKKKKFRIRAIIAAVIVVIVLAFAIVLNSDFIYTKMTALNVGGEKFTVADFNYWYGTAYMDFYESNYDSIDSGYLFDTSKSLRNQYIDEEKTTTWADYFKASALSSMKNVKVVCDAAAEAGFTLTDEQKASIRSSIENTDFESLGYKSLKTYLASVYGKGVSEKVYLKNTERYYLASMYSSDIISGYEFTEDEITNYYNENAEKYDRYIYNMYYVAAEKADDAEKASDEAMAAAKMIADDLVSSTSIEDFSERILKYCDEGDKEKYSNISSFQYSYTARGLSTTFKDFLVSEDREPNDTGIIDMNNGYYVLFFVERGGNNYNVVNYRRILINVATDSETGLVTTETYNNAKTAADGIYNMVLRNPTEDNFTEITSSYSADTTNVYFTNVGKDESDDAIEEWLFDEARQPGDISEPLQGTNCFYILYYEGTGEIYWKYIANKGLASQTYADWVSDMLSQMTSKDGWLLRFADYQAR